MILRALLDEVGDREASTRAVALVRIGMAIVVLAEWGDALILTRDPRPLPMLVSLSALLSAISLLVGFHSRVAAVWAAASSVAVMAVLGHYLGRDDFFVHHHTHMMMLALWLLALTPCGHSYSVDRWLAVRRGRAVPPERDFVWAQRLIVVLVSSVYLWGVAAKLNPGFLSGARLEQLYMVNLRTTLPEWTLFHPLMLASAWGTLALEVFIALGLWSKRWRLKAIAGGAVFHFAIYYTLEVSTFTAMMLVLYIAALDPDDVHRWIDEVSGVAPARTS